MRDTELDIPLGLILLQGTDAHISPLESGPSRLASSHPADSTVVHAVNLLIRHGRIRIEPEQDHSGTTTSPLHVSIWAVAQDTWPFAAVSKDVQNAYFQMLACLRVKPAGNHYPLPHSSHGPKVDSISPKENHILLLQDELDTRLLDIYLQLPSPSVNPSALVDDGRPTGLFGETASQLLEACIEMDSPEGMKTKLYGYQKRSLYKMVQRELLPRKMYDPAFVPLRDRHHQPYILNTSPNAFGIYKKPPFEWDDVRGGILCEDMGTGKTCICIALILHTRHQISLPPVTAPPTLVHCDIYPVMKPAVVDLEDHSLTPPWVIPAKNGVPSLLDIASTAIKVHGIQYSEDTIGPYLAEKLDRFPAYTLEHPLRANQGAHVPRLAPGTRKKSRQQEGEEVVKVYLSSATLVIVPANLVDQWCFELNKHTHDHALEVLVIPESSQKPVPPAETLIKQDIVLISQSRFSREYDSGAFVKILASKRKCTCDSSTTFARCRCPTEHTISPLQHVRWKRIIVDEGHSMGSQSSNYALLASTMYAERRWICTGTPTLNLSNLADYAQPTTGTSEEMNDTEVSPGSREKPSRPLSTRRVALSDQEDLIKLSTIVSNYLRLEPFTSGPKIFSKELQAPFSSPSSFSSLTPIMESDTNAMNIGSLKRCMSAVKLRRLMDTLMVRNQPEDIMKDISLPPLHEKIVRLPFEYFQALTHNCQVALIHANAVLSEREGVDYFFHPKNTKHLRQVINNLQQSCFWFSGGSDELHSLAAPHTSSSSSSSSSSSLSPSTSSKHGRSPNGAAATKSGSAPPAVTAAKMTSFVYQVQEALGNVQRGLEKDRKRREAQGGIGGAYPPEDVELLRQIAAHLEQALQDESWTRVIQLDHMAYFCRNLPRILQPPNSPKHLPSSSLSSSSSSSSSTSMEPNKLAPTRSREDWHAVLSEDDLVRSWFTVPDEKTNTWLSPAKAHICMVSAEQVEQAREAVAKLETTPSSPPTTTSSLSSNKRDESSLLARLRQLLKDQNRAQGAVGTDGDKVVDGDDGDDDDDGIDYRMEMLRAALTRERLSQATIVSSGSSKLNYIVSRILGVHRTEKTIVFCEHPNAIWDLYHYLVMAKSLSQRSKNIMTFNTSENVSVLLMDTHAGSGAAYGIDLSAASRIYFVSPPFHTALERQAIKRAHRIGQKRPVFVETLVIQDSFEEAVLVRRREEDDALESRQLRPTGGGGSSGSQLRDVVEDKTNGHMNHDGETKTEGSWLPTSSSISSLSSSSPASSPASSSTASSSSSPSPLSPPPSSSSSSSSSSPPPSPPSPPSPSLRPKARKQVSEPTLQQPQQQPFGRTMEKDGKMRDTIRQVRFIPLPPTSRLIRPLVNYAYGGGGGDDHGDRLYCQGLAEERERQRQTMEIPVVFPKTDRQLEAQRLAEQANMAVQVGGGRGAGGGGRGGGGADDDDDDDDDEGNDECSVQLAHRMERTLLSSDTKNDHDDENKEEEEVSRKRRRRVTFAITEPEVVEVSLQSDSDLDMEVEDAGSLDCVWDSNDDENDQEEMGERIDMHKQHSGQFIQVDDEEEEEEEEENMFRVKRIRVD
ncbi:hypothetical protein DFQ27_003667 [Actinomortierella ambigua]|uniref:Helicase ATP-binding domain-containing protein n=1 Tax=Actinomortierella ambigua TaxID=1343610 RepID=A0A9P6Q7J0_9FUNG|nr:hypothetical protein DFQ27_003667 [Actinomortierella ambigua]